MQKKASLISGIWAAFTIPFFGLFVFLVASGFYLWFREPLDFYAYFVMKRHVEIGFVFLPLFYLLTVVHLQRLYRWSLIAATLAVAASVHVLMFLDVPPLWAFGIFLLLMALLIWRYLLYDPASRKLPIIVGVGVWGIFNLILASGITMAGPTKATRTNFYHILHGTIGLSGVALIVYHFFTGVRLSWSWKKLAAFVFIFSLATGLLIPALHQAGWYQAHKVKKKEGEGYRASAGARFSPENAKTCGSVGCHTEIYKQWRISTHRFSATNRAYQKVFALFKKEMGEESARFCERCHNPDVVHLAEGRSQADLAFFTQQGVSCLSCHLIHEVHPQLGNGKLTIGTHHPYLPGFFPETVREWRLKHDFIRTDLSQHRRDYQKRPLYQEARVCAPCHKLTISSSLNEAKPYESASPYTSWKKSIYARQGITCQHCHMQLFSFKDMDSFEKPFHARPDHRFFGINATLAASLSQKFKDRAKFYRFERDTIAWLRGQLEVSSYEQWFLRLTRDGRWKAYENFFRGKPVLSMEMEIKKKKGEITLSIETRNSRVGHDFPISLLDMIEVWQEVVVKDAKGNMVFSSGILDPDGSVPLDAHRLGGTVVDKKGKAIEKHRIWKAVAIMDKRVIPPQGSVQDSYRFKLPKGSYQVRVRWLYRRGKPSFARWVFGERGSYPVVVVTEKKAAFEVSEGSSELSLR